VSTTLGIFSALELEILLVFQPRDLVSYGAFQKRMLTIEWTTQLGRLSSNTTLSRELVSNK